MSTFQIDFPGTPTQFTTKAGSAIKGKGGMFDGTDAKGKFHIKTAAGAIEGTYETLKPEAGAHTPVAITISKKPFFVSTNQIQKAIQDFL